ncbi:MAG TPA: carbohydrate binding family 9 domain-containing protein, partial [Candidatus Angelobacter sp.]|nr:carbohydrate binding family 9 domain-containing protein [Candidatus Angelobacter sp.]
MAKRRHFQDFIRTLAVMLLAATPVFGQRKGPSLSASNLTGEISSLTIPRINAAPKLGDFEGMEPASDLARKMLKIDKFIQQEPRDGTPVSQPTEAYLGYTDKNFYAVFLCFDKEPEKLRARMLRRELIDDDDQVGLWLDTFHDRRHAYYFYSNPYGIQQDGFFSESGGPDNTFDTVWHTSAKINGNGYVVMIEIPFKSLRFKRQPSLSWGVILIRVIPR